MNPEEYTRMFDLEDHYWWFVGRRHVALKLLKRFLIPADPTPNAQRPTPSVLDLGCGTGVVSRELASWTKPYSLDMSEHALRFCQERHLPRLVQARGEWLPLREGQM